MTPSVARSGTQGTNALAFFVALGMPESTRLRTGTSLHLGIRIVERVALTQLVSGRRDWSANRSGYRYELHGDTGQEILAFHLHPDGTGFGEPHLHISSGAGNLRPEFHRAHLPTGEIALEAFLAFVIRDFGVRPLRADYAAVLAT